jgi:FixJ family two-component response regulator
MTQLLIADSDNDSREKVAAMLTQAGYNVLVSNSVANVLDDTLKRRAEVIILGQDCDNMGVAELVHLLKQCNRNIPIILLSGDQPLPVMRKVRSEGIFYHARKSFDPEARQELLEAVKCAFKNLLRAQHPCSSY